MRKTRLMQLVDIKRRKTGRKLSRRIIIESCFRRVVFDELLNRRVTEYRKLLYTLNNCGEYIF